METRLPSWFKQHLPDEEALQMIRLLCEFGVKTVCQEALCPNIVQCFKSKKATLMILGDVCTRNCGFCGVDKNKSAKLPFDADEPYKIKELVNMLGLNYVVITSVSRDDLPDGGADIFAQTILSIRGLNRNTKIEALIPDFEGRMYSLKCVLDAKPDVVGHNIETVNRIFNELRPQADYELSLDILSRVKEINPAIYTKSSLMLGLGESEEEVVETMKDLRSNGCDVLTLGQYLAPSLEHYPIKEFISPAQFQEYRNIALSFGFRAVLSGPLVRSSYRAEELHKEFACTT